jgi:hypothetical protein
MLRRAGPVAARGPLGPHFFQGMDAVLRPRPLRLYAAADPHFLLRQLLVELRALHFLRLEHRLLAHEKRVVVARPADQPAAVHFHDARRQLAAGTPGRASRTTAPRPTRAGIPPATGSTPDRDGSSARRAAAARLLHQAARQQHAALLPGRQRAELLLRRQPHLLEQRSTRSCRSQSLCSSKAPPSPSTTVRTLPVHARPAPPAAGSPSPRPPGERHLARVGQQFAGDHFHQRRLARPVAADETHAFAAVNLEIDAIEQRRATEAQADIEKTDKGHGNRSASRPPAKAQGAAQVWAPFGTLQVGEFPAPPPDGAATVRNRGRGGSPRSRSGTGPRGMPPCNRIRGCDVTPVRRRLLSEPMASASANSSGAPGAPAASHVSVRHGTTSSGSASPPSRWPGHAI